MYERIQGDDMYNAGPNIPFSLQVDLQQRRNDKPEPRAFYRLGRRTAH